MAMQHPALHGIPLPSGFNLVPANSFYHASGRLRYANCQFAGSMEPAAVSRFYKEHMPAAGFTLRRDGLIRGEYELEFDSAAERCDVRFHRQRSRTFLFIDLTPVPQGSAERDARRPLRRP